MDSLGQLNPLMLNGESLADKQNDAILDLTDTTYYDFTNNHFALMSVLITNDRTALLAGIPRGFSSVTNLGDASFFRLEIVVAQSERAPGFGSNRVFNGNFIDWEINKNGQYFFSAVTENIDGGNKIPAIWRGEVGGTARLIVQEGMKITVNGEEQILERIITSFLGKKTNWLSDNGDIIFLGSLRERRDDDIFLITDDSQEQRIFSLAEQLYPQFFSPANVDDQLLEGFVYRYYPMTNTYIGVKNGEVFVLGDAFGSGIQRIGTVESTLNFLEK